MKTSNQVIFNPTCEVMVGFRNKFYGKIASKYMAFNLEGESNISALLLKLSHNHVTTEELDHQPVDAVESLIDYGYLVKSQNKKRFDGLKNLFFNFLNENKNTQYKFREISYKINSFVFMIVSAKIGDSYIKDRIILPCWRKHLSRIIYDLAASPEKELFISRLNQGDVKKLLKKGVLIPKNQQVEAKSFAKSICELTDELEISPERKQAYFSIHENKFMELKLNSHIFFAEHGGIPEIIRSRITPSDWVKANIPTLWLDNPKTTQMLEPYWLNIRDSTSLRKLIAGDISISDLPEITRRKFYAANILYLEKEQEKAERLWKKKVVLNKALIEHNHHMHLQDFISPMQLTMWKCYARYIIDNKLLVHDKTYPEIKQRYWNQNDGLTIFLHEQFCSVLNQILKIPVKAASTALNIYQPGARLSSHRDDILEYSHVMTLVIDTMPERNREYAWPLCMKENEQEYSFLLQAGDAAIIHPQSLHWRSGELEGHSLAIMLLWFVPHNYTGYAAVKRKNGK